MFTIDKLNESTSDFQKYVEPQLYSSGLFNKQDCYVITCEGANDDLKTMMDRYAGIDMCNVDRQNQTVQGIASRVQKGTCWETFTIRALTDSGNFNTELKKRSCAIYNGDMYPTWTMQAYLTPVDSKTKCTVGIVRTTELFNYILSNIAKEHFDTTEALIDALKIRSSIGELEIKQIIGGGAVLVTCSWNKLKAAGVNVTILESEYDNDLGGAND